MPQTVTETMLDSGPLRVWAALTDPDYREAWAPIVRLAYPDRVGPTACYLRVRDWERTIKGRAQVERLDKPRAFVWSWRVPLLLRFEERYELRSNGDATGIVHTCRWHGLLAWPLATALPAHLATLMTAADDRLARFLRWRAKHPAIGNDRQREADRFIRKGQ